MHILRRLYSSLPREALAARTSSTPRAVRLRRQRKRTNKAPVAPGKNDATHLSQTTPTEHARYTRLVAQGELGAPGNEPTEKEWLDKLNDRRQRIRGVKPFPKAPSTTKSTTAAEESVAQVQAEAEEENAVVGQAIYLPNIIFRLVRNQVKPGEQYNPYEATFRIPQSITKTDIRSYLFSVYGVKTTYIRTDNYLSPLVRTRNGYTTKSYRTYKRAVVGLVEPFYYPQRIEDLEGKEKEDRKKWIEENMQVQQTSALRKYELLRLTRAGSKDWKWRGTTSIKRSNILKLVAEKRARREGMIADQVQTWQEMRAKGETISLSK